MVDAVCLARLAARRLRVGRIALALRLGLPSSAFARDRLNRRIADRCLAPDMHAKREYTVPGTGYSTGVLEAGAARERELEVLVGRHNEV
jgi:hypothetical protein